MSEATPTGSGSSSGSPNERAFDDLLKVVTMLRKAATEADEEETSGMDVEARSPLPQLTAQSHALTSLLPRQNFMRWWLVMHGHCGNEFAMSLGNGQWFGKVAKKIGFKALDGADNSVFGASKKSTEKRKTKCASLTLGCRRHTSCCCPRLRSRDRWLHIKLDPTLESALQQTLGLAVGDLPLSKVKLAELIKVGADKKPQKQPKTTKANKAALKTPATKGAKRTRPGGGDSDEDDIEEVSAALE